MPPLHNADRLHQKYLDKLQQLLDLAMHTAAAASTEGNHKIVLQAVREATRIITLMTKMTGVTNQDKGSRQKSSTQIDGLDGLLNDLSALTEEIGRSFPIADSGQDLDAGNCPPLTGNPPCQQRAESGKIPGKSSYLEDFFKKNKRLKADEKIFRNKS
jgi:hypothetical protein